MAATPSSIPLRRHMTIAVVGPVLLLLAMGVLLAWQMEQMSSAADLVSRTDAQLAKLFELRMRLVEQESALRGYLLSGDRTMLVTLEEHPTGPIASELDALIVDAAQKNRVAQAMHYIGQWQKLAEQATAGDHRVAREDGAALQARRTTIRGARDTLDQATSITQDFLAQRSVESEAADRTGRRVFIGLILLSGLTIAFVSRKQLGAVSRAFQGLVEEERAARDIASKQEWVRHGEASVGAAVVGERTMKEIASAALEALCKHTDASVGALYQVQGTELHRVAEHALPGGTPAVLGASEGVIGQVLREGKPMRIADAKAQIAVAGGIGETRTVELVIVPAMIDDRPIGVLELGYTSTPPERADELFAGISRTVALAIRGAEQRLRVQQLLEQTQHQSEELQTQHEELRVTNEELEHQTSALREAHVRQENVQHELEEVNANLEAQTAQLESQREELMRTQHQLEERARDLQQASQYKSDFLARMSHELRTPLNSTLILARLLGDNPSKNLSEEQVKFAETIYSAGNDLLLLINDILDLAKIEAGRLELRTATVPIARVRETLLREFEPVAKSRGLAFSVDVAAGVPPSLHNDEQRLVQVLRNLVSNACKFTEKGSVRVQIDAHGDRVRFAVTDTGIGIPLEHTERVFEAFHQVDGGTSRKHGGTGLGLAISRDLATLLQGTLTLRSEPGKGSTFTLEIPTVVDKAATPTGATQGGTSMKTGTMPAIRAVHPAATRKRPTGDPAELATAVSSEDDRERLSPHKKTLLAIEDDRAFSHIVRDLGRELGYQVVLADTADEGVALALRYRPDGILLDVNLPDHSGLSVLERLKRQPAIRHVPIHMMSADDHSQRSLELGAIGYLLKPTNRDELTAAIRRIEDRTAQSVRRLLVVEDDEIQANALKALLGGSGVEISTVGSIKDALQQLSTITFDCVVMDLRLRDGTGFELLEKMTADERITFPPVIVHTGKSLSDAEEAQLRHYSSAIIVKGARSPERLVDEVTLFLHQVEAELPLERQRMVREVRDREALFENRIVLIVEDDVRNVFALSSILEPRGLKTVIARNGREALEVLERQKVDLVLMDIMMPEMNGIEATQRIRQQPELKKLPVIALTAKAMADDRQACLDAGANDYLAKPINVDMLLSLLRVWMPR